MIDACNNIPSIRGVREFNSVNHKEKILDIVDGNKSTKNI
jgi:hypothetical protein